MTHSRDDSRKLASNPEEEAFLSRALLAYRLSDAEGRADLIARFTLAQLGNASKKTRPPDDQG